LRNVYPLKCLISNAGDGEPARVEVYDDIGEGGWFFEGLTAKAFSAQLASVSGALDVHINSYGGDVADGQAIASTIRNHKGHTRCIVDGMACSAASVILQAGKERIVEPGGMVMIHDASGGCMGNAADMASFAEVLDKISDNIAQQYADRAGGTAADWREAMRGEKWYTADETVDAGLADRKGTGQATLPAGLDLAAFAVPDRIAARLRKLPAAKAPAKPKAATDAIGAATAAGKAATDAAPANGDQSCESLGHQCCKDAATAKALLAGLVGDAVDASVSAAQGKPGTHGDHERWDPDGNGDCDACPEGDTDNSHWSESGEQLQSVPGSPMPDDDDGDMEDRLSPGEIRAFRQMLADLLNAGDVDNSDWDASKAWHNGAESDDPAAFYAGICAGKKAGDKSTQDAWALPYKYSPSSKPNAAGVKNALSRLPQTDDLTNAAEAKSLLQGLMKKINPDYEPAEDHSRADPSGPGLEQFRSALEGATR